MKFEGTILNFIQYLIDNFELGSCLVSFSWSFWSLLLIRILNLLICSFVLRKHTLCGSICELLQVRFRLVMFQPFVGEVISARLKESNKDGLRCKTRKCSNSLFWFILVYSLYQGPSLYSNNIVVVWPWYHKQKYRCGENTYVNFG